MGNQTSRDAARRRIESSYRKERPDFLRRARRAAGALFDAEDVVQDAFVAALRNIDAIAEVRDLSSWIYSGIRNRVIDLWRRDRTRKAAGQVKVAEETLREIVAETGLDPQEAFLEEELVDALTEAIEALPEKQRSIVIAQVFEGKTFREISEASGVPIETLSARKRAALRALAQVLREWIVED